MRGLIAVTVGLACGTLGCAETVTEVNPLAESARFFNLVDFVARQDSALRGEGLTKTVVVNGLRETKEVEGVDWADELATFAQSDIDRPALWDQYAVDSAEVSGGRLAVTYEALYEDLFTRRLRVVFDAGGEVRELRIDNAFESIVADTEQHLEWAPGRYRVYSRQAAQLADERELEIEGVW